MRGVLPPRGEDLFVNGGHVRGATREPEVEEKTRWFSG